MNTQTMKPFTLNLNKVHDTLDTLRAELNAQARERGLDGAFNAGVLTDALRDTDLGQRYLALTRRADRLAHLPDRRQVIGWSLVAGSAMWLARRRGWDKRVLNTLTRAGRALRARLPRRRAGIPAQFAVTPAATAVYDLARNGETVRLQVPKLLGDTLNDIKERSGRLITLGDEYFAVLVGEMPCLFLPDQVGDVQLSINADGSHTAVITLLETPFFDTEFV